MGHQVITVRKHSFSKAVYIYKILYLRQCHKRLTRLSLNKLDLHKFPRSANCSEDLHRRVNITLCSTNGNFYLITNMQVITKYSD